MLPAETVITREMVANLESRNIATVLLDYRDIASAVQTALPEWIGGGGDSDVATAFKSTASAAPHRRRNPGTPVPRERVEQWRSNSQPARSLAVWHGQDPYDPTHMEHLAAHFRETANQLNALRDAVLKEEEVSAGDLADLVDCHFDEMTRDANCTLSAALEIEIDDAITAHSLQMSVLGMAIGVEYDFDYENTVLIGFVGMVHDWGLMRVPAAIRNLERPPDDAEFEKIKQHPRHTQEILRNVRDLPDVVSRVSFQVHERLDGSGYPQGLEASDIFEMAQILYAADVFLTTSIGTFEDAELNPYATMVKLLHEVRDGALDPDIVRALLRAVSVFPVGSRVNLSDGALAQVIRTNPQHYTQPIVRLIDQAHSQPPDPAIVDLLQSELKVVKALADRSRSPN